MPPNQIETATTSESNVTHRLNNRTEENSYQKQNPVEEDQTISIEHIEKNKTQDDKLPEGQEILWGSVSIFVFLHGAALYLLITNILHMRIYTMLWAWFLGACAIFGVTGGVHRLWSHKTYKAKAPLRIILGLCYSVAAQYPPWDWVRDHRVHHKYSDTDADPHNASRGLFYSHIGWLMQSKHPDMVKRERDIDMSDIIQDKIFMVFTKYYPYFGTFFGFVIPILVPVAVWNESMSAAITAALVRYILSLNFTFSINSLAHKFGERPYKENILPTDGLMTSIITLGEGWHNYHHAFPWDYRAGELGPNKLNFTATLLNFFASIGWAYDLKEATPDMVYKVSKRHGDGSRMPAEVPYPGDK